MEAKKQQMEALKKAHTLKKNMPNLLNKYPVTNKEPMRVKLCVDCGTPTNQRYEPSKIRPMKNKSTYLRIKFSKLGPEG